MWWEILQRWENAVKADQQLGKSTYPALLGLEQARKKARDLIEDARQSLKNWLNSHSIPRHWKR